ncbi:MAG: hypothetical protein WC476_13015 [Phycisphaerae bacterium]|jgi:hypothetical protein
MKPANQQERDAISALLYYIKTEQGIKYSIKTRPEENPSEKGTYDFLCSSDTKNYPEMSVEIVTLLESRFRKSFDKSIQGVAEGLVNRLKGKLLGTFELQIVGPSKRAKIVSKGSKCLKIEEKTVKYKELQHKYVEFVRRIGHAILEAVEDEGMEVGEQHMIFEPLLCDLIMTSDKGSEITVRWDYYDPDMPKNFGNGGFLAYLNRSLSRVLTDKNEQLRIAKGTGRITALVLSIDPTDPLALVYGTVDNIRRTLDNQPKEIWKYIDQIFLMRKKNIKLLVSKYSWK